jgi:hypothetical protein
MVSITHVRVWLRDFFNILSNNITVQRYHPEDILITFKFYDG